MSYVIVTGEVAVGDGDGCGALDDVDEPITAVPHRQMVEPNVRRPKNGNPISITLCSGPEVVHRVPDRAAASRNNVVYVEPMYDDILDELERDPSTMSNAHICPTCVNCLVARQYELLRQPDSHAACKYDPQRLRLNDGVAESPWLGVDDVAVGRVGDDVESPSLASTCPAPEALHAVGQLLPVVGPVLPASPAAVDWVCGLAGPFVFFPQ